MTSDAPALTAPAPKAPAHRAHPLGVLPRKVAQACTRADQIARSFARAAVDGVFRESIASADAARDRGEWGQAERAYRAALGRCPWHWGYLVQLGHALKEQERTGAAEIAYRSAFALGAAADEVDEHLAWVARVNGVRFVRKSDPQLDVAPMQALPTRQDVLVLARLCGLGAECDEEAILRLMRHCPDNRTVLLDLMGSARFAAVNGAFLDCWRRRA